MCTIACLLLLLLFLLLLLRPVPVLSTPRLIPASPQPRHVSFTFDPPPSLPPGPSHRRWSFHKRIMPSIPDSPRTLQREIAVAPTDQFGRILPSDLHSVPKPLTQRLSFTIKRRFSSTSCTSTLIHLDRVDARAPSPSSSLPATHFPLQRTKFANPFSKHSRSRIHSPQSTFNTLHSPSASPSLPARPRSLVNKFKSIFRPEPSPIIHSKPFFAAINTRLRRKPVARTQPYGPPWNAPMPVPDFVLSPRPLVEHTQSMSHPSQTSQKRPVNRCPYPETPSMLPGRLSPRTFINELDEKLSLLQEQSIRDPISSPDG